MYSQRAAPKSMSFPPSENCIKIKFFSVLDTFQFCTLTLSCEYLEVNEIVESTQGINWQPPCSHKIVKSDLVYSPAQVTEHHSVELKDHNVSEKTTQQFEELKAKYFH